MNFPGLGEAALLLDVDGTLLDFAPTPESVVVPDELIETLGRLRAALGGALALVTGRPVEQVDALLEGVAHAVAGEHGGALRRAPGGVIERPELAAMPVGWLQAAERLAAGHPGVRLERKQRGFVLHYRQAPTAGAALKAAAAALVAEEGERFQLLEAAMAWEVRPAGMDKGVAVEVLMAAAPFAGRVPVFIGDDVTDEDGIRAAHAMGGVGLLVGPVFGGPEGVRRWLRATAEGRAFPEL